MVKNKVNYSIIEEDFIRYYKKTYKKHITTDFFKLSPREMGLDSLDAVEMLVWAEEQYNIHTALSDYLETQPIQQFIDVIYEKIISNK